MKSKFILSASESQIILHRLPPKMIIQIIINDDTPYDPQNDIYETFQYKNKTIISKWYTTPEETQTTLSTYNIDHLRSILRRAYRWYRSQNNI